MSQNYSDLLTHLKKRLEETNQELANIKIGIATLYYIGYITVEEYNELLEIEEIDLEQQQV